MLSLEYKPTNQTRKWKRANIMIHDTAIDDAAQLAKAIHDQEGWYAVRIIDDKGVERFQYDGNLQI